MNFKTSLLRWDYNRFWLLEWGRTWNPTQSGKDLENHSQIRLIWFEGLLLHYPDYFQLKRTLNLLCALDRVVFSHIPINYEAHSRIWASILFLKILISEPITGNWVWCRKLLAWFEIRILIFCMSITATYCVLVKPYIGWRIVCSSFSKLFCGFMC